MINNSFKCTCKNVGMGEHTNALFVPPPDYFNSAKAGYWIDKCIFHEVMILWSIGVVTTGCCCGHNKPSEPGRPYIGVENQFIPFMKDLGYAVHYNHSRPGDEDSFTPIGESTLREIISEKYFKTGREAGTDDDK